MRYFVTIAILLVLTSIIAKGQQEVKGITTIGGSAVTETVGNIMARDILGAQPIRMNETEKEKEYPDHSNNPQNPSSPLVSNYGVSGIKINQQTNSLTSLSRSEEHTSELQSRQYPVC